MSVGDGRRTLVQSGGKNRLSRLVPIVVSLALTLSGCLVADPDDYRDRSSPTTPDAKLEIVTLGRGQAQGPTAD